MYFIWCACSFRHASQWGQCWNIPDADIGIQLSCPSRLSRRGSPSSPFAASATRAPGPYVKYHQRPTPPQASYSAHERKKEVPKNTILQLEGRKRESTIFLQPTRHLLCPRHPNCTTDCETQGRGALVGMVGGCGCGCSRFQARAYRLLKFRVLIWAFSPQTIGKFFWFRWIKSEKLTNTIVMWKVSPSAGTFCQQFKWD